MMDRMMISAVSGADNRKSTVRIWPALVHRNLKRSCPSDFLCSNNSLSDDEIYLLPILSYGRWNLFRIDPQRRNIDFLDFSASARGCEIIAFQAS
jgi:hypothetical protein